MADEEGGDGGGGGGLEEEVVCPEGAPEWVVTFGDMMSLLLTFFILLLSFSTMDVLRFKEMSGSIKQAFGVQAPPIEIDPIPKAEDHIKIDPRVEYNAKKIMEEMRRKLDPKSTKRRDSRLNIEVFQTYRGVTVLLSGEDLFEPGSDKIRKPALALLGFVANQALEVEAAQEGTDQRFDLAVEARSPPSETRAPQFPDTWALTTARAVSAAGYMRSLGLKASKVMPVGRGPAPPDVPPGTKERPRTGTLEFVFLSRKLKPE